MNLFSWKSGRGISRSRKGLKTFLDYKTQEKILQKIKENFYFRKIMQTHLRNSHGKQFENHCSIVMIERLPSGGNRTHVLTKSSYRFMITEALLHGCTKRGGVPDFQTQYK